MPNWQHKKETGIDRIPCNFVEKRKKMEYISRTKHFRPFYYYLLFWRASEPWLLIPQVLNAFRITIFMIQIIWIFKSFITPSGSSVLPQKIWIRMFLMLSNRRMSSQSRQNLIRCIPNFRSKDTGIPLFQP